ncbi:MAG: beta strand repeat-containing protein, partial [Gammaproteobacteria bacterium]
NNNILTVNNHTIANFTNTGGKITINFVSNDGLIVTNTMVNTIITSIQYSNSSNDPINKANLTYMFNDGMGANTSIISANIIVNINPINNAPINVVPLAQAVNQNGVITFSLSNANAIKVIDVDSENNLETITLSVNNGVLNLTNMNNVIYTGNGSNNLSITGNLTNINTVLNGLIYKPNTNFYVSDLLKIVTNDNANTGSGGALTATNTVNITINQLNVYPTINNLATISANSFTENGSAILINNQLSVVDLSLNALNSGLGNYTGSSLSLSRANGSNSQDLFSFATMADVSVSGSTLISGGKVIANFTNTSGKLQINFVNNGTIPTTSLVTEIAQAIKYNNSSNDPPSSINLSYTFNDGLGLGNYSTVSSTITVNINQINNAPTNIVPGSQTINQNAVLNFSSSNGKLISIADLDAEGASLTVNLTATNGILALNGTQITQGLSVTGNNTASVQLTGNITNINNALNGLSFTPKANYSGSANITIVTNDNGNTGTGGALTATNNIAITINAVATTATVTNAIPNTTSIFMENGSAVYINNNGNFNINSSALNILNSGLGNYNNTSLTITNTLGGNPQDLFSFGSMSNIQVIG